MYICGLICIHTLSHDLKHKVVFKLDLLKCTVQRKESEIVSFVVALSTAQLMQIATVQYQIRHGRQSFRLPVRPLHAGIMHHITASRKIQHDVRC